MEASCRDDEREGEPRKTSLEELRHGLREPLSGITSLAELLEDGLVGTLNEEQRKHVASILRKCERLDKMIDSLFRS